MGCRNDYMWGSESSASDAELKEAKRKLDQVTRLLCGLCKHLESEEKAEVIDKVENGELLSWWKKHKKFDAKREAEEAEEKRKKEEKKREKARKDALKASAIAKLSKAERKALGVKEKVSDGRR